MFVGIWATMLVLWIGDWLPDVLAIGLFSILILNTAYADGFIKKALNNKVLTYLGDISYSIYMVHIPLILTGFIVALYSGKFQPPGPKNLVMYLLWIWLVIGQGPSL